MRLIDSDALVQQIRQQIDPHNLSAVMAAGAFFGEVNKSPTVDAVPVVRCRDCVHYNTAMCAEGFGWCERNGDGHPSQDEFYCADGERREADV